MILLFIPLVIKDWPFAWSIISKVYLEKDVKYFSKQLFADTGHLNNAKQGKYS